MNNSKFIINFYDKLIPNLLFIFSKLLFGIPCNIVFKGYAATLFLAAVKQIQRSSLVLEANLYRYNQYCVRRSCQLLCARSAVVMVVAQSTESKPSWLFSPSCIEPQDYTVNEWLCEVMYDNLQDTFVHSETRGVKYHQTFKTVMFGFNFVICKKTLKIYTL